MQYSIYSTEMTRSSWTNLDCFVAPVHYLTRPDIRCKKKEEVQYAIYCTRVLYLIYCMNIWAVKRMQYDIYCTRMLYSIFSLHEDPVTPILSQYTEFIAQYTSLNMKHLPTDVGSSPHCNTTFFEIFP